ncbi:MAG: hypothetical protein HQ481_14370 [Alphaproteobacteria bacterium]|nr:hypothetical protein [Alphaproteobacteria bacterium]
MLEPQTIDQTGILLGERLALVAPHINGSKAAVEAEIDKAYAELIEELSPVAAAHGLSPADAKRVVRLVVDRIFEVANRRMIELKTEPMGTA